jgi:hypothetical protein
MSPLLLIALLAGLPFVLGFLLRVHTSALFLSIASGYLLSEFFGETSGLVARSFLKTDQAALTAEILVFFIPILVTLWLMRGSLAPRQLVSHFVPLVGCALLVMVLGLRLLPPTTQFSVYESSFGSILQTMPDVIIGFAVAAQLILMWATARPRHH